MKSLGYKIIWVLSLIVVLSLITNFFRQVITHQRVNKRLADEQKALQVLERKNQELKKRLEEVKSPQFLEQEAASVLNLSGKVLVTPTESPNLGVPAQIQIPNYKRWWKLVAY